MVEERAFDVLLYQPFGTDRFRLYVVDDVLIVLVDLNPSALVESIRFHQP